MSKRLKIAFVTLSIFVAIFIGIFSILLIFTPRLDRISADGSLESYFISNTSYFDYQEENDCAAYATAYVLRCMGGKVTGKEIYPQMQRFLGIMTARSIEKIVEEQGHSAKSYHGNIGILKIRLQQGCPIICLITNEMDTHYVVAVGYDSEYIYFVDSIKENENVLNSVLYNRKIKIVDFELLWKNNFYMVNNVYIIVS